MRNEELKRGTNVVAINIVDYDFLPVDNFHTCFRLREDDDHSLILTPALEIHFVNMVKRQQELTPSKRGTLKAAKKDSQKVKSKPAAKSSKFYTPDPGDSHFFEVLFSKFPKELDTLSILH